MSHEVIIDGSTFVVNNFSAEDAKETLEQLLKRVIVQNAESEFKKQHFDCGLNAANSHDT